MTGRRRSATTTRMPASLRLSAASAPLMPAPMISTSADRSARSGSYGTGKSAALSQTDRPVRKLRRGVTLIDRTGQEALRARASSGEDTAASRLGR